MDENKVYRSPDGYSALLAPFVVWGTVLFALAYYGHGLYVAWATKLLLVR